LLPHGLAFSWRSADLSRWSFRSGYYRPRPKTLWTKESSYKARCWRKDCFCLKSEAWAQPDSL